jgi:gliding motility-associated-like protein
LPGSFTKIILLCSLLLSLQTNAQLSNARLALYLPMNGNAGDSSGNNYHGLLTGAISTTDVNGNPNSALYFDLNSRILINNPFLLRGGHEELTILMKIYIDSIPYHPDYSISPYYFFFNWRFKRTSPIVYEKIHLVLYANTGQTLSPPPLHQIWGAGSAFSQSVCSPDGQLVSYHRDSARVIGKWFSFAFVFNRSRLTQYYNCKKLTEFSTTFSSLQPCETDSGSIMNIYIGNAYPPEPGNTTRNFTGKLDELRIYKRALNEAEIKAYAGDLCTPEIEPYIKVEKKPCTNNVFTISDESITNGVAVARRKWRITRDNFTVNDVASFEYTCTRTGNYTVYLDVEDVDGYHYLKQADFSVSSVAPPPRFPRSDKNEYTLCGNEKSVHINLSGANSYQWSPCSFVDYCDSSSVTITPQTNQVYIIRGIDAAGCKDSTTIRVNVSADSAAIFVPSAFTPNNDGVNDLFGIQAISFPPETGFEVYNRWGEKIFETKEPNKQWDGTRKSIPQPAGVYVWKLNYGGATGCAQTVKKGTVLLIR